jgi:hypothetical protein
MVVNNQNETVCEVRDNTISTIAASELNDLGNSQNLHSSPPERDDCCHRCQQYREVYLKIRDGCKTEVVLMRYVRYICRLRLHSALGGRTLFAVYWMNDLK